MNLNILHPVENLFSISLQFSAKISPEIKRKLIDFKSKLLSENEILADLSFSAF